MSNGFLYFIRHGWKSLAVRIVLNLLCMGTFALIGVLIAKGI
jgi:hypothetical protein